MTLYEVSDYMGGLWNDSLLSGTGVGPCRVNFFFFLFSFFFFLFSFFFFEKKNYGMKCDVVWGVME
jgi:hypothetical protein